MASSPCNASTQRRMRRPEPVRRPARAAAADSLLDRRLPDLWTQAARLDRLSSCAAMTSPNGVLLVGRPDAVLSGVELPGDAWSYRADGLRACSRPHLSWKRHCLGCEWKRDIFGGRESANAGEPSIVRAGRLVTGSVLAVVQPFPVGTGLAQDDLQGESFRRGASTREKQITQDMSF